MAEQSNSSRCYAVLRDWTITNLAGCAKECARIDKMDQGKQRITQGSYWRGQSVAYTNLLSAIDELDALHDEDRFMYVPETDFGDIANEDSASVAASRLRDAIEALLKISKMTPETANVYSAARIAGESLDRISA